MRHERGWHLGVAQPSGSQIWRLNDEVGSWLRMESLHLLHARIEPHQPEPTMQTRTEPLSVVMRRMAEYVCGASGLNSGSTGNEAAGATLNGNCMRTPTMNIPESGP